MKKSKVFAILCSALLFASTTISVEAKNQFESIGNSLYSYEDGTNASFRKPTAMAYYKDKVYIADTENNLIRVYDISSKKVSTLSGKVNELDYYGIPKGAYLDGSINEAQFNRPTGIDVDKDGVIYVADSGNNVVRKIVKDKVYTLSGTGVANAKDGVKNVSQFNKPSDVLVLDDGSLLVTDTLNNALKLIDKNGNSSTIIDSKVLLEPTGLARSNDGILIVDSGNQRILKLKNSQVLELTQSTTKVDPQTGYKIPGLKNSSYDKTNFAFPKGIFESDNVIYVADTWNNSIRILSNGSSKTFIDKRQLKNSNNVKLKRPYDVLVVGNQMYISDSGHNNILIVDMD